APSATLGSLTTETASSLTLTNAPAAGVSFSNIVANGTSQIAGSVPILLRSPSPSITINAGQLGISAPLKLETNSTISTAAGTSLTLSGNVTTTLGSGDLNLVKSGLGVLNITGGTMFAPGNSPNRIINMTGGTTNFTNATVHASSLITQTNNNVYMTATNSIIDIDDEGWYHGGLRVGWGNGVYSYAMNGGSLTLNPNAEIIRVAGNGNTGRAILSLNGGATVSTGGIDVGETDNTYGEINIRDASIANSWEFRVGVSKGLGVINQLGATSSVVNDLPVILTYRMGQTTCWGIYNLNAGTLKTSSIVSGDGNTQFNGNRAFVNFHGGTLTPTANSANLIYSTLSGANAGSVSAPQLMVYSEGAVIDTDGKNITIGEKLLAPTGQGVAATTITLAEPSQGSGYRGEPVITIGNSANFSATAVANMVDDGTGNGTFKIASITVTNPGVNFTTAPALNIYGGDPTLAAILPATLPIAANLSGGLTKNGAGALTLAAANTYAGATNLNAGSIIATNASALGTTAAGTTIASAATLDVRANIGAESLTLGGSGLSGNGTLITGAIASTGTVGGPITLNAHTILGGVGTLNLNGAISGGFNLTKIGAGTTSFGAAAPSSVSPTSPPTSARPMSTAPSATAPPPSPSASAPAYLKFGSVSPSLASLTIGAGSTVTFSNGLASGAFTSTDSKATNFTAFVVPEPSSVALLLVGSLGMLNRRRRSA
ncbi:MAG: PEP-CTERM sorting domain-containing protein, partial [Verrucomicrobia bacterium]|nr:PEP-CTERM sorting domain-containing protein [Verrucomicrobiota bacterium]